MKNRFPVFLAIAFGILITTIAVIFFARGYTINLPQKKIEKTGMILVQSTPKEAKIYLDGKLVETTDAVLGSLPPKNHHLRIEKEGFSLWEKDVPVFGGLVTKVEALLIPNSPNLTPLTNNGVGLFSPSPQGGHIAYTTENGNPPGLWILDLSSSTLLNLIQENPRPIAEDTKKHVFSLAEKIAWSPKEEVLLVTLNPKGHVLLDAQNGSLKEATASTQPILSFWEKLEAAQKSEWARKLKVPRDLIETATAPKTQWSPDKKKFLFEKIRDDYKEWHVYNGEEPLGVGRKREYIPLKLKKDSPAKIFWHATSNHLIVENQGTISIVEIDGSNQTEVYSGNLTSPQVIPTPDGTNLIILASFKQNEPPNLYAIGLK